MASLRQLEAWRSPILRVRRTAQVAFALEVIKLARHRAAIEYHSSGQYGGRDHAKLLQLFEDPMLSETQIDVLTGEFRLDRAYQYGA